MIHPEPFTTEGEEYTPDPTMSDWELENHLAGHEANALGYYEDQIADEQATAIDYYYRRMLDIPAMEGCSSVVDGTVAIVIDNALASILKPFVSSNETVSFAPRGPEDEEVAQQATDYCNYVFEKENAGFILLHDWFKDALLTKIGVVKCWWEVTERVERKSMVVSDDVALGMARMSPGYQGEQVGEDGSITVEFAEVIEDGQVRIVNVPPEEFQINPFARSLKEASYIAHVPKNTTRSDLIEMGFDPELVDTLPGSTSKYFNNASESNRRQARYEDEQHGGIDTRLGTPHRSQELVDIRDEFVRIDYDGDGIAELRRVIRAGETILLNEEVDELPFAVLCPVPMPHKVIGLSLADQTLDLQRISTVILRQTLDNLYKTNNPRPVVGEGAQRDDGSTQDSISDNAPGAAILLRDISQFRYGDSVPFFARESFGMLEYIESQQEARTGIARAGQGMDADAIKGGMTATEVAMINNGRNARAEMIARIFAETGVKDLFKLILGLLVRHQPRAKVIKLRNEWVEFDPSGWPTDLDVEISVGLGMGDKAEKMAAASAILQDYAILAQSPFASMVGPQQVYNAMKMKLTAAEIKNIDDFLIEPTEENMAQEPQGPSPEEMEAQAKTQMEMAKLQGEQQLAEMRIQLKAQEQQAAHELAREKAAFEAQLAREKAEFEAQLASWKARQEDGRKANMTDNRAGGDLSK